MENQEVKQEVNIEELQERFKEQINADYSKRLSEPVSPSQFQLDMWKNKEIDYKLSSLCLREELIKAIPPALFLKNLSSDVMEYPAKLLYTDKSFSNVTTNNGISIPNQNDEVAVVIKINDNVIDGKPVKQHESYLRLGDKEIYIDYYVGHDKEDLSNDDPAVLLLGFKPSTLEAAYDLPIKSITPNDDICIIGVCYTNREHDIRMLEAVYGALKYYLYAEKLPIDYVVNSEVYYKLFVSEIIEDVPVSNECLGTFKSSMYALAWISQDFDRTVENSKYYRKTVIDGDFGLITEIRNLFRPMSNEFIVNPDKIEKYINPFLRKIELTKPNHYLRLESYKFTLPSFVPDDSNVENA